VDENGVELPVYTEEGFQIKRMRVTIDFDDDPPTLLADLRKVNRLFNSSVDEDMMATKVFGYSQAFTNLGNFQAHGPIPPLQTRINLVNQNVRRHARCAPPIQVSSLQGYNRESHLTRYSSGTHAAQTGAFTQILSGTYNTGEANKKKFETRRDKLLYGVAMPHDLLCSRITNSEPNVASNFRLEAVFTIEMDSLDEATRTSGR